MTRAMAKAILILPVNALGTIPALLLWAAGEWPASWAFLMQGRWQMWVALALIAAGLSLLARTIALFGHLGKGSLAPWSPTRKLVVAGPYRHVRNPMHLGVFTVIFGEALLFSSWALTAWGVFAVVGHMFYFPFSEEPGLERRFGDDYRRYKANVPRWLPRLTPWQDAA